MTTERGMSVFYEFDSVPGPLTSRVKATRENNTNIGQESELGSEFLCLICWL